MTLSIKYDIILTANNKNSKNTIGGTQFMATKVHRKTAGVTGSEVIAQFRTSLEERSSQYEQTEIEALADFYAKNLTDNFIVSDVEDIKRPIKQGDIYLYHETSQFYQDVIDTVTNLKPTDNMNLQDGEAMTGDHRIHTIADTNMTIQVGRFEPKDRVLSRRQYDCKLIESDKPFLITHQEHGNIAVLAGKYLAYTAIDPTDLQRVID